MSQASLLFRSSPEPVDRSSLPPKPTRRSGPADHDYRRDHISADRSHAYDHSQRNSSPNKLDRSESQQGEGQFSQRIHEPKQADSDLEQVSVVPTVEGEPVAPSLELVMPVTLDPAMMTLLTPAVGPQPEAVTQMVALSLGMNRHPATAQAMAGHANNLPDLIASLPPTKVNPDVQVAPETLVQQDWLIHIGEPLPQQVGAIQAGQQLGPQIIGGQPQQVQELSLRQLTALDQRVQLGASKQHQLLPASQHHALTHEQLTQGHMVQEAQQQVSEGDMPVIQAATQNKSHQPHSFTLDMDQWQQTGSVQQQFGPTSSVADTAQSVKSESSHLPNPLDRVVAHQVSQQLTRSISDQQRVLTIRLTPPELGTVKVQVVEQAGGTLRVTLQAEDDGVRAALERSLPHMRQELRHQDSMVRDIQLADHHLSLSQEDQQNQQEAQQHKGQGRRGASEQAFSLDGEAPLQDDLVATSVRAQVVNADAVDATV